MTTRVLEVSTGFSHMHSTDSFSSTLPSQGSALRTATAVGMIGRVYILRTGEELKSLPSIGQVLLIGHLVVVFLAYLFQHLSFLLKMTVLVLLFHFI